MSNLATLTPRKEIVTSVSFNDLRLPYIDAFADGFGIDNIRWKVLIDAVFPAAKTVDSIAMALSYCKERNLDVFKRPVHIVPMWSSEKKGYVETVWPGISELRTTAARTGAYAGCNAAEFGPTVKREFRGIAEVWENRQKVEREISVTVEFPEWCQLTVHRVIKGQSASFVSPKVYWTESYARRGKADVPNDMWCKRPFGQLEKCAEAAALRRAFPEEIGNEYTAEEMEGQTLFAAPIGEVERPKPKLPPPPPPAPTPAALPAPNNTSKTPPAPNKPKSTPPAPPPQKGPSADFDFVAYRAALDAAETLDAANAIYADQVERRTLPLTGDEQDEADNILREIGAKFWNEGE